MAAKALLSVKADSTGQTSLAYDRAALDNLIADVRKQQSAAQAAGRGIQKTNINYAPTTDTP